MWIEASAEFESKPDRPPTRVRHHIGAVGLKDDCVEVSE